MKKVRVFFTVFTFTSLLFSSLEGATDRKLPPIRQPKLKFPPAYMEVEPVEDNEAEPVRKVPSQKNTRSSPSSLAAKLGIPVVAAVVGGAVIWRVTKVDYPPKTLQFVIVSHGGNPYKMRIDPPAPIDPVEFVINSDKIYSPGFENPVAGEYRFTTFDYTVLPIRVTVHAYIDGIQVNSIDLSGNLLSGIVTITEANVATE